MKSGTRKVRMSPGMAYWSAIWPELVVKCTGVGMVVTGPVTIVVMAVEVLGWFWHSF